MRKRKTINSGSDSSDSSSGDIPGSSDDNLDNLLCTEVLRLLQSIDTSKVNGPDEISGKILKATATSITYPITIHTIQQVDKERHISYMLEGFPCHPCTQIK